METHWDYTAEDLMTTAPYEELYRWREEPFLHAARLESLAAHAQAVGVPGFRTMYRRYVQSVEGPGGGTAEGHLTAFTGQPLELDAGEWEAGDDGVRRRRPGGGEEVACPHPLLPVERLVDLDTGEEKLKLAFCKGGVWRQVVAPRTVLANAGRVTELAGTGMGVTSQTARAFVSYLAEVEQRNYERIPERRCVSRLGHIPGVGFAPYVEGLAFDGDPSLRALFQTVRAKGSEAAWLETARAVRDMSAQARILLAASFASVLLEPLGCLPFFVHLWGVESGSGKTVALMAAASVWGDPAPGAYVKTFDGTVTGLEKTAAFLSHLPLCLDELQLAKDERGRTCFDVYRLAQGVGRTRGTRTGGLEPTATWRCCILTTGESPLTGPSSGAGAFNRVLDIQCPAGAAVVRDGMQVAQALRHNFGFAGRRFVEALGRPGAAEAAQARYEALFQALAAQDTTEKQAMAAAAVVLADELACQWIFGPEARPMDTEQMGAFLAARRTVSAGERAYRLLCGWTAQNAAKLCGRAPHSGAEVLGTLEGDRAYIIRTAFQRLLEEAGFSEEAVLSYLLEAGLAEGRSGHRTRSKRINGIATECVCLRLPPEDEA